MLILGLKGLNISQLLLLEQVKKHIEGMLLVMIAIEA